MAINEWVSPLCIRNPKNKSMSGRIETKNSNGILTLTLSSIEEPLPNK